MFSQFINNGLNQFDINVKPTYEGCYWKGHKVEGLLINSRMVQGIFDDISDSPEKLIMQRVTKACRLIGALIPNGKRDFSTW